MQAVFDRDPTAAASIIPEDDRVDELEIEVDERVTELLALFQPMATDLRMVMGVTHERSLLLDSGRLGVDDALDPTFLCRSRRCILPPLL